MTDHQQHHHHQPHCHHHHVQHNHHHHHHRHHQHQQQQQRYVGFGDFDDRRPAVVVAATRSRVKPAKNPAPAYGDFRKFDGGKPEVATAATAADDDDEDEDDGDDGVRPKCFYEPAPLPPPPSALRTPNLGRAADCKVVEWEIMSKHFAAIPSFVNDKVEKYKNGYSQTNLPQNHHLHYYRGLHKLHQVVYATRNTYQANRNPQLQRPSCCKPWQWNMCGGSPGTFVKVYYLSEPRRYTMHAKNIIQDDSRVIVDETDQLSWSVWRKYTSNRQSERVYDMKMAMWRRLSALIKTKMPGCGLYLVGSTMNGFGGDVSDADFCLLTGCPVATATAVDSDGGGGEDAERRRRDHRASCGVQRLQWLMGLLQYEYQNGNVAVADMHVVYAKVPVLHFRWSDGTVDVDLCCNNVVGIRNTHLLYCYSRLDYRVRPLVLTVKLWASRHNINDPKKMTLSSYSLVLMVINFLQCVKPPVLPSLQRIYNKKFSTDSNIEYVHMHEQLKCDWISDNRQSLGELLLQFFEYYNNFNYCKHAVSVRMGMPIMLERCRLAEAVKNDPGQWKFIGIEEPFERTNTARSVHNHNVFAHIKDVICTSYHKLKETMSLDSIFCEFEKKKNQKN